MDGLVGASSWGIWSLFEVKVEFRGHKEEGNIMGREDVFGDGEMND